MSSSEHAEILLQLATPPRAPGIAKRRLSDEDTISSQESQETCEANATTTLPDAQSTPMKKFRICAYKVEKEDMVRLCYMSEQREVLEVPLWKGDTGTTFENRRDQLLKQMFDDNRGNVFCSWRDTLVSILVKDARWTLYKESLQQKRYLYKTIQLVVTRFTCTQWREGKFCRNCSNKNWRTGCQQPSHLLHVLPLPVHRNNTASCEAVLMEFSPRALSEDATDWKKRVPQTNVR